MYEVSKYGFFSGPYFSVLGLITEIYGVNLRVRSEYMKTRTKKNSVLGHFSRGVFSFKYQTNLRELINFHYPWNHLKTYG